MQKNILIEVSARHCHLSKKHIQILFGKNYKLKKVRQLTQPADFYAEETVGIEINGKKISGIRVVGPEREQTQVEISATDAVYLGTNVPVKLSGDLNGSAGALIIGPEGTVNLEEGLIVAERHIHCTANEAEKLGLKKSDRVSVEVKGERPVIFEKVVVRVRNDYKLCMHLDTDEGNAAGINKQGTGIIL